MTRRVRKDLGADSLEELGINTAIQLAHEIVDHEKFSQDHLFMEDDLYYVVDDDISEDRIAEIQASAEKCADKEPCSKFGIVSNIDVATVDEIVEVIDSEEWQAQWGDKEYYLYANDTQNTYERSITLDEWSRRARDPDKWRNNTAKNHYPGIVSNVEIDVEEPEDKWRQQNGSTSSKGGSSAKLTDF
jgi:hypothetical protein